MKKAYGLRIPETLEEAVDPKRCALVVYDMQAGILGQLPTGAETLASVSRVLNAAREAEMRTIFMRHLSMPKKLAGVFQLRMAMAWQRVESVEEVNPWFLRGSEALELVPELEPRDDEAVLDKITMSAFEGTPLSIILRDCNIDCFIIVGVATEIGIDPTVRHGADLGLIPIVVTDACGAGDPAAAERSIANMKGMGDAMLTTTEELILALSKVPQK